MANTLKFGNGEWYGKKDTILAYNSENNNYKPLPFDFSRGSSATVINKDGLIETVGSGEPRIDYKDNSKGALLLEPSRINLVSYSEDFSNSYWNTNSNTSRSLSSNLSPEGTANAYRVEAVSGTQVGYVGVTTIGTTITHSVYVRRVSGSNTFNMVDVNNSATQVDITNEWKRFSVTAVATSTNLRSYLRLNQVGDVVEIFGFQAEQGSYATSYIPTQGSVVTRLADSCSQTPPDGVIGQTEGTVFLDFIRKPQNNPATGLFGISSSNNSDRVVVWNNFSLNGLGLQIKANGSNISGNQSLGTFDNDENYKIAVSYKSGEIKAYVNGNSVLNLSNSFTFASDLNTIIVNSYQVGINSELSPFKNIKLYNTALTDQELQALTSN